MLALWHERVPLFIFDCKTGCLAQPCNAITFQRGDYVVSYGYPSESISNSGQSWFFTFRFQVESVFFARRWPSDGHTLMPV
jgi:hypothetical protein